MRMNIDMSFKRKELNDNETIQLTAASRANSRRVRVSSRDSCRHMDTIPCRPFFLFSSTFKKIK